MIGAGIHGLSTAWHMAMAKSRRAPMMAGNAPLGVRYIGLCCGEMPHHIRSIAEALGRKPPASRYSADMSKHAYFGNDARLKKSNREFAGKL